MNCNFISCSKWIRRGIAKSKPEVIQFSNKELKSLVDRAKNDMLVTAGRTNNPTNGNNDSENVEGDFFGMEEYDNNEDTQSLIGIENLISFDNESSDPDLQMEEEEEDDSDKEDDEIKETDNLIAVGHVDGDISILKVYVYNEESNDLYVHHDIVLPTFPLSLEWLSFVPGQKLLGNLLAIGGMSPEITIWDLDVINSMEPLLKLGEFSNKKKYQHRNHGHRAAVLDLAWNTSFPHVLASGSVDHSVLLWDLNKTRAVTQFCDFNEKVQTLNWHPSEGNILIAGSCDSTVNLLDCRIAETVSTVCVKGEVEKVVWHPMSQFFSLIGTSEGQLCCLDCRNEKILWEVKAHSKEITDIGIHCQMGDLSITCSTDQTVKVWRLSGGEPKLQYTKHPNLGDLHCLQVCPENPDIYCVGGNKRDNNFAVYDLSSDMQL